MRRSVAGALVWALASIPAQAQTPLEREAPPKSSSSLILPTAALAGGAVFDVVSTTRAFERGCLEGNTLLYGARPSPARLVGVKAAGTVGVVAFMWFLQKTGHSTLAKVFGYGAGAASATAGVLNTANRCGGAR